MTITPNEIEDYGEQQKRAEQARQESAYVRLVERLREQQEENKALTAALQHAYIVLGALYVTDAQKPYVEIGEHFRRELCDSVSEIANLLGPKQ